MVELLFIVCEIKCQGEKPVSPIKIIDSANKKYKMHARILKNQNTPLFHSTIIKTKSWNN